MAKSALDIIVNVVDAASKKLTDINKMLRGTGDAAKKTSVDMIQFNRVMFSTSAFVGLLQKQLTLLNSTLDKGAELGRIQDQFEAVLGPKGALFKSIDSMTNASIDKMEAMRSGIALKSLGIANNVEDIATIITGAGVAAKRAGLDSSEGIKKVTQALKDGNLTNLEFLNLIRTNDPALKAYLSVLNKYSGVLGGAVTAQQKHAMIMRIVTQVAKSAKDENEDLYDVLFKVKQSFTFLRGELGQFLGEALKPTLQATAKLFNTLSSLFSEFKQNKNLVFLAKSFMFATTTVIGFYSALFVAKNAITALGALGFGVPKLIATLLGLGMAFQGVTNKADGIIEKLKVFGGFLKGIYELITNFDPETGLSKISESTARMLEQNGILELTKNISRAAIVVKTFAQTIWTYFVQAAKSIDTAIGGITSKLFSFFGAASKPWARSWIDNTSKVYKSLAGISAVLIGIIGASKLLGSFKSILTSLPFIGGLFGGGSSTRGTPSNPMYVKSVDGSLGATTISVPGTGGVGGSLGTLKDKIWQAASIVGVFVGKMTLLAGVLTSVYAIGDWLGKKFQSLMGQNTESALSKSVNERVGWGPFSLPKYGAETSQIAKQIDDIAEASGIDVSSLNLDQMLQSASTQTLSETNRPIDIANRMIENVESYRKGLGLDIATGKNVTEVPQYQKDSMAQGMVLREIMGQVNEQDRLELETAMKSAQEGTSAGGKAITPEEWKAIFMSAINNSTLAEEMAKTAKNTGDANKRADKQVISTRRGC